MPITQHCSRLIMTQAAAHEAERRIQEWIANHAGPDSQKARRAISTQGQDSTFQNGDLFIQGAMSKPSNIIKRCSVYAVSYRTGDFFMNYAAHGLVIFPQQDLGPGAISLAIQSPAAWASHQPPWHDTTLDPAAVMAEIFDRATQQDFHEYRKRTRRNQVTAPRFGSLQEARQAIGPVLLITPKGRREDDFSSITKEYGDYTNIVPLTETDQLSMSQEVPDPWLRDWLDAAAILVKESEDPVQEEHPLTRFDKPHDLRPLLDSVEEKQNASLQDSAQGEIVGLLMCAVNEFNAMEAAFHDLAKKDPMAAKESVMRLGAKGLPQDEEETQAASAAPAQDNTQELQRISTLEDQLQQEKDRNAGLDSQITGLRAQLEAYEQYMKDPEGNAGGSEEEEEETHDKTRARAATVLHDITQQGRFPHLRFLPSVGKNLDNYGKARPLSTEIIEALDAVNTLAGRYIKAKNGSIGPWTDHFKLRGWTYANSESETTMGKHLKSRTFRDQEKDRNIVVQRHLTYRGSNSGLQIFFDDDGPESPFVIAYIGAHLPYVRERT